MTYMVIGGSPCTHWEDIDGYEGLYRVSENGDVLSVRKNRLLTLKVEQNGYVRVHVSKQGVPNSLSVHRLVAEALRRKVKVEAAALGMTMNEFILLAIENQINRVREE